MKPLFAAVFLLLHFQINDATGRQILTRFYTRKGILYLRPGNWYKCVHNSWDK